MAATIAAIQSFGRRMRKGQGDLCGEHLKKEVF
jgi:hypothetical protein